MKTRKELLLSALLLACGKPDASSPPPTSPDPTKTPEASKTGEPPPVGRPTGGGCMQNYCPRSPSPAPAASQAAPGFPTCPQTMHVEWTSQPNPRPFSAELTRQKRAQGMGDECCYEAQRLCGGGRPLVGARGVIVAELARRPW